MARSVEPKNHMVTYRQADGELVHGKFSWVASTDYFEDDCMPTKVVRESWRLEERRISWIPTPRCIECGVDLGDTFGIDKDDPPWLCDNCPDD